LIVVGVVKVVGVIGTVDVGPAMVVVLDGTVTGA
jgi:hypothetical protein